MSKALNLRWIAMTTFDPGAKEHVLKDYQYISYFVSGILEFQMHRALCITAGQCDPNNSTSKPLYLCDIYKSSAAGNKLKSVMALGRSRVWQDALEMITGQRQMDAAPLKEFFHPLYLWLVDENKKSGQTVGWTSKINRCSKKKNSNSQVQNQCRYV